ncbi:DNA polymerase I [Oecophyllibacter saccharovorans]|uniref:DNA polymerase I n=1 Tax=Oecophyllibacter saccharovorans TaxID=2558360 RepID=UPI001143CA19|nr:DNA polymerase I [Oecophyllibacter saccharovorans]QDH15605.1 DNA polymerase I [Oecophyllibacter saccharovorans]
MADTQHTAPETPATNATEETTPSKLVLVDGSGFIFRAFHALPPMNTPDGTPVNAVYGFTNMLSRLTADHPGAHVAVIFDAARQTFRNDIYPPYKAHRPPPPEDLRPQFALMREATEAYGIPSVELEGWEADDILATYARQAVAAGQECVIITSDKDLMQLVRPGVTLLDPIKQKPIGSKEVEAKFGVPPAQVIDVQALMGDATDNVPGVPGIGPKGAAQLVQEHGGLEAILAAAPEMKPSKRRDNLIAHAGDARMSRKLVTLADDVPVPLPLADLRQQPLDRDAQRAWLERMGFNSLLRRLGATGKPRRKPAEAPVEYRGPEMPQAEGTQPPYGPYATVTTSAQLEEWVASAREAGVVAIDTETTGLDARNAELVGISLATAPGQACYIPLRHEGTLEAPAGEQLETARALELLDPLLADDSVLKVFQNAKYDLTVLHRAGAGPITPIDDTMLLSYVQSAGAHGQGMDELAERYLSHKPIPYSEVTGKGRNKLLFSQVPVERATAYAGEDADVTLRLWHALRPGLVRHQATALYEGEERPLIPILEDMEQAGIRVDAKELQRLSEDFSARMAEIEKDIHRLAGRPFNVGSPKQLGDILFGEMNLPGGKRTRTGAWSTDSSVLDDLAEQGHELPVRIRDWRQLSKLKTTYADALLKEMDASQRVHTNYQMTGTITGRLSSSEPNLQNIPVRTEEGTRIRKAFVAAPGRVLLSADYSQIELRLLAHVAKIPSLIEAFRNGEDIHARTASEVFNIPLEEMDSLTRRRAKAINFGIIYGISPFGLARQLQVSQSEAKAYIEAYFARYPGIRDYMERMKAEAREKGYVTTPFGRRCYLPAIGERNGARRAYAERLAINAPLQGGAADIIKRAMVQLARKLPQSGLDGQMLLQVHDELVFEVAEKDAAALAELVKEEMESAAQLDVALAVETGTGHNWAEAH